MTDRDAVSHERQSQQRESSSSRLHQLAREDAREEIEHVFEAIGVDVSTRAGREDIRGLLTWAAAKRALEAERNAQVRRGLIDQVFGLMKWAAAGGAAGLGAYFGIKGTHP